MEFKRNNKTLNSLVRDMRKGKLSLQHELQRREGQWNRKMQSELIDSLLRDIPIDPVRYVKDDDTLSVIDGIQRLSTIRSFFDNEFALSKDLKPVIIDGKEYEIAGKKYENTKKNDKGNKKSDKEKSEKVSKRFLDPEVKEALDDKHLDYIEISNYTDSEITTMFARQNSGKSLNNKQKRSTIENREFRALLVKVVEHPFFRKALTSANIKSDLDKEIVRQVLMLAERSLDDIGSFASKDVDRFIIEYQDNVKQETIDRIMKALDNLDSGFEEFKMKPLGIPMAIYGEYAVLKRKGSTEKYRQWLISFMNEHCNDEEYTKYCKGGTSNFENVKGRFEYFMNGVKGC